MNGGGHDATRCTTECVSSGEGCEPRAHVHEQTLGWKPKQETAGGVIYEFGAGTQCFLYPTPNAGTSKASQAYWQMDDVEREVAELKQRGVTFEEYDLPNLKTKNGVLDTGAGKAAWFKDTEGNILALVE